jgi:hypothetical protein
VGAPSWTPRHARSVHQGGEEAPRHLPFWNPPRRPMSRAPTTVFSHPAARRATYCQTKRERSGYSGFIPPPCQIGQPLPLPHAAPHLHKHAHRQTRHRHRPTPPGPIGARAAEAAHWRASDVAPPVLLRFSVLLSRVIAGFTTRALTSIHAPPTAGQDRSPPTFPTRD